MRMPSRRFPSAAPWAIALPLLLAASPAALAHAILVEASPAAGSTVSGPDLEIRLRFNSRIDGARCHVTLVQPDKQEQPLTLGQQPAPTRLTATDAGPAPRAH